MNKKAEVNAFARASKSVQCLPFKLRFYKEIVKNSIKASELVNRVDYDDLVLVHMSAARIEEHFHWMMKLGILRREVDGQGLTNRFKITPLGRSVISQWTEHIPRAGLRDRIFENFKRHNYGLQ